MRSRTTALAIVAVILIVAGGIALLLPQTRPHSQATPPQTPPEEIVILGTARDFHAAHADFQVVPAAGLGHDTGLVERELGAQLRPVLTGEGRRVLVPARDSTGRAIPVHLANHICSCGITDFQITNGLVYPGRAFAAMVSVLGAAIETNDYDMPVTVQVRIGNQTFEPFGPSNMALAGNVNDDGNPRHFVFNQMFGASHAISILGTSWLRNPGQNGSQESHWHTWRTINSLDNSPFVKVLRDGDEVPDIEPFHGQGSIASFVREFIDPDTGRIRLEPYQVIYLYELGVTDLDSPAADFQDLVVVVTLATSRSCLTSDTAASLGQSSHGAITSEESFTQWFTDVPGTNMSRAVPFVLTRQTNGTYVFDDETDPVYSGRGGFFPIDHEMFGNEGAPHNHHFTFYLSARFTYHQGTGQYITYAGNADAWGFVDHQLGLAAGGVHDVLDQRLDVDRLCLVDGQIYDLRLFLAERHAPQSRLRIETNIVLEGSPTATVTDQYD